MEIKWPNVVAMGLAILAVVLAVRHQPAIHATLATVGDIGPGFSPEEQTRGLVVLGVILVSGVAIVRLLIEANRRNDP